MRFSVGGPGRAIQGVDETFLGEPGAADFLEVLEKKHLSQGDVCMGLCLDVAVRVPQGLAK